MMHPVVPYLALLYHAAMHHMLCTAVVLCPMPVGFVVLQQGKLASVSPISIYPYIGPISVAAPPAVLSLSH